MTLPYKKVDEDYVIVHKLRGDKQAIDYLKSTNPLDAEEILFAAKQHGRSEFDIEGRKFQVTFERDSAYNCERLEEEQL